MLNSFFSPRDPYADLFGSSNKTLTQIITEKLSQCPLGASNISKLFKELPEKDEEGNIVPYTLLAYKRYGSSIKLALPLPREQSQLCLVSWFVREVAVYLSNQNLIKNEWGIELTNEFLFLILEKEEKK